MESNVTIAPVHILTATIIAGVEEHLAAQRNARQVEEEKLAEGWDEFVAALTGAQKERLLSVARYEFGPTADEVQKRNQTEAEILAARRETEAEMADKPLVKLLDFYRAVTDKEVEVAPDDAIIHLLPSTSTETA